MARKFKKGNPDLIIYSKPDSLFGCQIFLNDEPNWEYVPHSIRHSLSSGNEPTRCISSNHGETLFMWSPKLHVAGDINGQK